MVTKEIELGDLVRIYRDFRYTRPISGSHECSHGTGLVVKIEVHSAYKDTLSPREQLFEYSVLWNETGNKTKHFIGQLTKISGGDKI